MSAHSTLYQATGLAALFAQHADTGRVRYCLPSGVETDAEAVIGEESTEELSEHDGRVGLLIRRVHLRVDADEQPLVNSVVKIDGVEYAVRNVQADGGGSCVVTIGRSLVTEPSRPNYRPSMRDPRRRA